jgi:uncharacterized repeat protein (TIGR01451 family)
MTNLTQLHIGGNPSIWGTLPATINNLTKLTDLNISSGGLSSTLPNITIPTLTTIYWNANAFNGSLPSFPSSIVNIFFEDNQFNGSLPTSRWSLTNLQQLRLWSNYLGWAIPSSWVWMTSLQRLWLGNNNLEWVMPVSIFQSMASLSNNIWWSMLGTNCFYNGSLTTGQRTYMDTKFSRWPNNEAGATWEWRNQKACGTDMEVVSATPSGTLQNGSQITYTVTIRNNGPRIAYDPKLTVTLTNGLQFNGNSNSSQVISLGQMAVWQTIVQTIIVNKLWVGSTTINYTNAFAVADSTTTDSISANNSKTHAGTANGSAYPICLNPATTVIQSDCEALGDFYTSTAWANWTRKDNWLSSTDVESWFGVTVVWGRVTKLCLNRDAGGNEVCDYYPNGNNVVWSLPSSITNLTELTTLTLSKNSITGPLPSTLGNLTKLQYFFFNENQINGSIPTTIWNMSALLNLYWWSNQLSGPIPSQVANMASINYIHLDSNQLSGPMPDLTNANDTLRILVLSNNNITGGLSWISTMTNLTQLHMWGNPLWGTIPASICTLTSLAYMGLYADQLVGTIPWCLWSMTPLVQLSIYSNNFTGSLAGVTFNLPNIYYFQIGGNPNMRGPLPSSIGSMTSVRDLYLPNMWLVWSLPSSLANLTLAYRFDVGNNYLDRDASNNALLPWAIGTWYANIVQAAWYKIISGQWDILAPLLGANAKRLPAYPWFNYANQPMSSAIIAWPNGSNVEAVLLWGSPSHVGYDSSYHNMNLQNGKTYTYSFWAKTVAGTRTIAPGFTDDVNTNFIGQQIYTIDTTWKQITIKAKYMTVWASPRIFVTNDGWGQWAFYYYDPIVTESTDMPTVVDTNTVTYPLMITDGSDWDMVGRVVSVWGWGSCSSLTVTPNKNSDQWLALYYNFDDSTVADDSNNGLNGTPSAVTFIPGKSSNSTAVSAAWYISHPTTGISPTRWTVSSWVNPSQAQWGLWQTHNETSQNWTDWISLFSYRGGTFYFRMGDGTNCCNNDLTFATAAYMPLNTWSHFTATWNGTADGVANDTMTLYVNGAQVAQRTNANFQSVMDPAGRVGMWHSIGMYAGLDDFRIYNRALTATEIAQMYNTTINISAQGTYNACYLTITDRGSNTSNAVRLWDFTATFSPYPICNNPARTVPQSECTALMDLYTSTAGANWTNKTNWGTSPNIDSWFGINTVTVAGKQYVSQICINRTAWWAENCGYDGIGNNMIGTLPTSIGSFPYLATLTFSNNVGLTWPIPTGIGSLTNLQTFYSTTTKLNGTLPDSMGNLNALTNLYLWGNDISGSLPSAWGTGMNAINYIHLDGNLLSWPIPASWANFANRMTSLILSAQRWTTKLNGSIPSWLGNFTKLNYVLYLNGNQFTGPIPTTLGNLTWLQYLYLGDNLLSWLIPAELGSMTNLIVLYLANAWLVWSVPTTLGNLTNLTSLYLSDNKLDRDLVNDAIIPSSITTWYNARTTKTKNNQSDTTAPVIYGNPLAGTYNFNTMSYTINMTEGSTIAWWWQTVTVAWWGTCSQITVAGTLTNGAWSNVVTLQFAPWSNATTAYSNCILSTTDRASNVSNTINLGTFSVKLNPFPICNNTAVTVSQEQCTALMDFYTNLWWASWTNKTNWSAGTTVGNWYGVTTVNSLIWYYSFDANNASDSGPLANNGTPVNSPIFVTGKYGNAINFDGTQKRVVISNTNIPKWTSDFTYSWWTKRNGTPNNATASYFENGSWWNSLIVRQETSNLLYIYSMGSLRWSFNFTPTVGQWYNLSIVRSGNTMYLYIDGLQSWSITFNVNLQPSTSELWIWASQHSPWQAINAAMDEVRIYNRALSADEVNQLYLSNTMGAQTVTVLRFTGANNMVGSFPNVLDRLPSLTALEVSNNLSVIGAIPSTISNLPKLNELSLNSLGINGSVPSTLPTTLTILAINNNTGMSAGPLPSAWSLLTGLTYLSVQNNNFNGALPSSWSALTNLAYLHLANNNFNSQIPTSWLTALTGVWQMYREWANIDGPLPPEMATWNTNTWYPSNNLNANCFGTGHLTSAQVNTLDTKYTRAKWAPQRACTTDLGLTVSQTGSVDANGNAVMYTITVTNNGSRWAYSPRVAVSLGGNLWVGNSSTTTLSYTTLAPWASQTQTISVIKSATSPTTLTNVTNTFTLSDPTIIDSNAGNNIINDSENVQASAQTICNNYAMSTTIAECQALTDLYDNTAGASWTNKSNWKVSPNIASWYGVTTNTANGLVAHYSFDAGNGNDDSGNGKNGVMTNVSYSSGRMGKSANFDASDRTMSIPSISLNGVSYTIALWTDFSNLWTQYWKTLIRWSSNHQVIIDGWWVLWYYDNAWWWWFRPSGYNVSNLKWWHHLVAVWDAGQTKFYVDGVLVGTSDTKWNDTIDSIGNAAWWWQNWWAMDDFRIYNRALSVAEISTLYQIATISPVRVTQIRLWDGVNNTSSAWGNNMSGSLPVNLTVLTQLTHLWLNSNPNLIGTIPSNFWNMTKIQDIRLMYTQFTGSLPTFGSSYPNLNYLDLSRNRISWEIPSTRWQNTTLTNILVWRNPFGTEKITGNLPSWLWSLANLQLFVAYYAGLTGSIPSTWWWMTQMNNFQIQGNQMSGPLPLSLSQWSWPQIFIINTALASSQFTGNLQMLSGWNTANMTHFMVYGANFDRDSNNDAIVPTNIATRAWAMWWNYLIGVQWDTTPPVLSFTSMATNANDVVQIAFTLTEWSSTTGTWYPDGLTVWFTGSAACASLSTSPVKILNKWFMVVDVVGAAGTYAWCSMFVRDRASLTSNLMSPGTIVIPNYAICGVVTDISRNDCRALVDIYTSTSGSWWINKANWMWLGDSTPTTASDWRWVTLSSNRVISLRLSQGSYICGRWGDAATNNMIGTLPISLGNLTWLTELCIAYNPNLTWWLPSTIGNLTALTNFVVHDNGIWWNLPASFSNLNPAQAVLYSNGFTGPVPSLANWTNLTYLYLFSNNFGWNSLPVLPTTAPNINTVYLGHAWFSGELPSSYSSLSPLQYLYVHDNNNLSGPIPSSWGNLTNLKVIHLHGNNLKWLIPLSFINLTNLNAGASYLHNNCLSTASSYMSAWLSTILSTKFDPSYTSQKNCGGMIWSRLWIDSDNDGLFDNGETGTGWVIVTLKSCNTQTPFNTWGKILNHQLATYYTFDALNTVDDSMNGNDWVNNGATFTAGKIGSAASFNGAGNIIELALNNSLRNLSNQITLSARVKLNSLTAWGTNTDRSNVIVKIWNYYLTIANGKVSVYLYGVTDASWYINSLATLVVGQWYHISMTYDGQFIRIYINGVLDSQTAASGLMNDNNNPRNFVLGWESSSYGRFLNGYIDDARVYSRALSATEISQLYNIDSATPAINFPISSTGVTVVSTITASNGSYSFTNQPAGKYYLEYSNVPNGYKFTTQNWWWYHNSVNSDVNPWSAKTSCFELYNGLNEMDIDAGIKYLPYSSCENTSAAYTPTLLGQPVTLSIGWYGSGAVVQAISSTGVTVLNVWATSTGAWWWLKTWSYNWTPGVAGTYVISGAVDGYNYKLDYYNDPALSTLSCVYRMVSAGVRCAMSGIVAPYSGAALTNVNQIASIPAPMQYCNAGQISGLPCSIAGDQPPAMVVQSATTCTSSLVVTSDVNVMCDAVTDMQPAECKALISLYDSTAGSSWTSKTNWRFLGDTTPRTACDRTGVVCGWWRVTQLRVGNNNLNGTLPALTGLNAMSRLTVSLNPNLKWNLPSLWSSTLTGLNYLYAWWNAHTGTLPTSWATWPSMQQMYLNDNQLTWWLPSSWSSLTNLTNLSLGGNPLWWTLPTSWSSLTKLVQLWLPNTQLTWTLPTSWSSLTKLTDLSLNTNTLQGQIPTSWLTLTWLVSLSLVNNQLDGPMPVGITLLSNLVASAASDINQNCMGTTHVSWSLQSFLNIKFPSRYASQKTCQTDLQLSLVSQTWSLYSGNNLSYTFKYYNAGSRWSYNTILGFSIDTRIRVTTGTSASGATDTGLNLGILAPGVSGTVTINLNKSDFSGWLYTVTNIFTLTDATISDTNTGNQTYTDTNIQVLASNNPVCNNPALTIPVIECETLFSWYNGLGWSSWITRTNWNASGTNADAGTWYGVTVTWGRVTELNYLTANNMIGSITTALDNLSQLTVLRVYNQPWIVGQLSGSKITSLPNLKILELSGTSLAWPVPATISNLTQLKLLTLIGNKPTTGFNSLPSTLWGMTGLTGLYLSNNYFVGNLPALTWFTSLQNLSLDGNSFNGNLPTTWASFPLKVIDVRNNLLTGQIPTWYVSLSPTLNVIKFDANEIDGQIPWWLTWLVNLQ